MEVLLACGSVKAAPFDLIVCGLGGEQSYQQQFAEWGIRLKRVLVQELMHPADHVVLLTEFGEDADGKSDRETIRKTLEGWSRQVASSDDLFIFLIGHGSFRRGCVRLNIPGPDLSAEDLGLWLHGTPARQVTVINAASASAPFINVLSGPARILCTSTRSADERYATRFMEGFIQGLEEGSADQNHDGRISVWEACLQASSLTQAWFLGQGRLATEHALLDDNGDGLGTRLDAELALRAQGSADGERARTCYLQEFRFPATAEPSLIKAYREAIREVEGLIARKNELPPEIYLQALENRLLKAARIHRQLRGASGSK